MKAGWESNFDRFSSTPKNQIINSLHDFVQGVSDQQHNAWDRSIPLMQREAREIINLRSENKEYGALLEYLLPYDGRRPDVVFLVDGAIVVLELKGKSYFFPCFKTVCENCRQPSV